MVCHPISLRISPTKPLEHTTTHPQPTLYDSEFPNPWGLKGRIPGVQFQGYVGVLLESPYPTSHHQKFQVHKIEESSPFSKLMHNIRIHTAYGYRNHPIPNPQPHFRYSSAILGTWRIIPVSKWLVTPIYKPFRPFGSGTTLLRGLTNHGY